MYSNNLMAAKNLLRDTQPVRQRHPVRVALLGFDGPDSDKIEKIFQLQQGERAYQVTRPSAIRTIDILLVNYDNPSALRGKQAMLANHPELPIVAASKGPLSEVPIYHVRGLLIATKLLGVLEKIPLRIPLSDAVVEEAGAALPPAPSLRQSQPMPRQVNGYRALVVDDSVSIQKSIELNLAALENITAVDFADGGIHALEKAQATHYDMIFLDVMMPDLDGYETCIRLRKLPQYKKTPIIMVSGKTSPLDEVKGIMSGCSTYLAKPVKPDEFQRMGRRVLSWLENYRTGAKSA